MKNRALCESVSHDMRVGTGVSHDMRVGHDVGTGVAVRMDVVPEAGREEEDIQGAPASCTRLGMSEHLWRHRHANLSVCFKNHK